MVDHKWLYTLFQPDTAMVEQKVDWLVFVLSRLDAAMRQMMAFGNEAVMSLRKSLSQSMGIRALFAHPCCQWWWVGGINKNTSGLLRQDLPRYINQSAYTLRQQGASALHRNAHPHKSQSSKFPTEQLLSEGSPNFPGYGSTTINFIEIET
jgi:IS30 family transposase